MVKADLSLMKITPRNVERDLEEKPKSSDRMRDGEQGLGKFTAVGWHLISISKGVTGWWLIRAWEIAEDGVVIPGKLA